MAWLGRGGVRLVSFLFLMACGDDQGPTAGTGGQTGGGESEGSGGGSEPTTSGSEGSGTDGTAASETGPTSPLDAVCELAAAKQAACGDMLNACDDGTLGACSEVFGHERTEMLEARAKCGFSEQCFGLNDYAMQVCIYEDTQDMEPTAAQVALAEALCASCFPEDDACVDDVFFRAEPVEGGAGVSGFGTSYLALTDAFTEQLSSQCVPEIGEESCVQAFLDCLDAQLMQDWPPSLVDACEGPG